MSQKEKQRKFEDGIDTIFNHLGQYITNCIKDQEDQKVAVELVSIFNELLITQLANRGYIDMEGESE